MKVVDDSSSSGSFVTIVALVALIAVGALAYKNRDRFLPAKATPKPVKLVLSEETETKFFEARDRIVGGKFSEASGILTSIDTDKVPQPTRNWITLQNGLAKLLDGKGAEGRAELAKLEKRGPFTKDPREEKLANFFVKLGQLGSSEEPAKRDAARDFDPETVEASAYLVLGVKNWTLDAYDDASYLLGEFRSSRPPDNEIWLRRYKPLADAYTEAFAAYSMASNAAKEADGSTERKEAVLKTIAAAKEKVKNQPGLLAKLTPVETELKKQVDAANAENRSAMMAADAADQKIIDDVKARVEKFNEKLQFADAHQIVFTATVNGEKAQTELDKYFKRTQWVAKFKALLIDDISVTGYPKPVKKKDGTPVAGGFKEADDTQLITPAKVNVPWNEFDPETLTGIARDFIASTKDPAAVNDRKWALGNFLYTVGKKTEAFPFLKEAAEANPEYKEGLALLPE
jgi:hypothetical protein